MGLSTAALLMGTTGVTPVGGTSSSLVILESGNGKVKTFIDEGLAFDLRKEIDVEFKRPVPTPSAPTKYSKKRTLFTIRFPRVADDGVTRDVDVVRIEFAPSIELSPAETVEMRRIAAQCLYDTDFDSVVDDQASA
jgi:hypothetical protein